MRGVLLSLMLATMVVLVAPGGGSAPAGSNLIGPVSVSAVLQAQTPRDLDVDINVNRGGGDGVWYRNPMWVAIAVIGGALVLLLIVLAIRGGGGTTIVDR